VDPLTNYPVSIRPPLDVSTLNVTTETPYTPLTAIPEPSSRVTRRKLGAVLADRAPRGLTPDQIEEYRRRLVRGLYNSAAVQTEVARRMLESGDL
jgi:hypothetical protein